MSLPVALLAAARNALATGQDVRPVPVAPLWAEKHGLVGDQPATIYGWAWETPVLAWLRVSLLEGGTRSQVFSALAIPRPQWDLPLFGAEVVRISGAVTVVALDWMPLFPDSSYLDDLASIRRRFDHFPPGGDLPPWAAASFSPHALFSRPRGLVPDQEIVAAFQAYFDAYLTLCRAVGPHGDPDQTLAAQRHYCAAHFTNDPGAAMLGKIFGAEWAEDYAREFLFRLGTER